MAERRIIHLDMDAFYASVEVLDHPELKGRPVIVGGSSNRGVVSAASYEARKYGIHSSMPILAARRLCPSGAFMPVRMSRYREISDIIMIIFLKYTPLVEPVSLDEAFLDVTGSILLFGPDYEIAGRIKKEVRDVTGLTVSAGVASSKLVAKIASDRNKPDGLTIVAPGEDRFFLDPLPVEKLWGVGRVTRKQLALLGAETIGDVARLPLDLLEMKFGVHGRQLHYSALGIDESEVIPEREIKSVGHEETFETDITDLKSLERELLNLASRVGRRLRRHGMKGRTITLKVKYHDFVQVTRSITLTEPTSDSSDIFRQCRKLVSKTGMGRKPVRLLGVSVAKLSDAQSAKQLSLFSGTKGPFNKEQLYAALDKICEKYGNRAILPGTILEDEKI